MADPARFIVCTDCQREVRMVESGAGTVLVECDCRTTSFSGVEYGVDEPPPTRELPGGWERREIA
ncbi:MAG: hypothetical protein ABEH77_05420 [Halobacteriaceae archaeon]